MPITTVQGQMLTAPLTLTGNLAFSDGSVQTAAASPYVLKNRIINGAMDIAQRGTSISVGGASFTYTLDRFALYSANSSTTVSQNTSVPTGFLNSIKIQRPNGNTGTNSINFTQTIESKNCYDLSGQSVTFSFWAKAGANYSSSGSTLGVQVVTGTVADQGASLIFGSWTGSAAPVNTSTTITTTWTRYTFTGTFGSGVLEAGFVLYWTGTGTAGADDAVYITGVQLEIGTSATPFERRLYGQELINCQRYYWQGGNGAAGIFNGVGTARYSVILPTTMRTTPTTTAIAAPIVINPTVAEQQTGSQTTNFGVTGYGASVNYSVAQIQFGGFSSGADGRPTTLLNTALQFSAEL